MIVYPTAFGSKVLHNGTTHYAGKSLMPAPKAETNLVQLANGRWHDPYGTNKAPVLPGKLTAVIVITLASEASLSAETDSLYALIGTRNTLTLKKLDDTTVSCAARLEQITLNHPFKIVTGAKTRVELTFQCITEFA